MKDSCIARRKIVDRLVKGTFQHGVVELFSIHTFTYELNGPKKRLDEARYR